MTGKVERLNRELANEGLQVRSSDELCFLIDRDWIDDHDAGTATAKDVAKVIQERRADAGLPTASAHPTPEELQTWSHRVEGDIRWFARCEIMAWDASMRKDVRQFRMQHLRQGTLGLDEVEAWIGDAARIEGSDSKDLLFVPSGPGEARFISDTSINAGIVHICRSGLTGQIKGLSSRLGFEYGWHEALAVAFLIAGVTPRPWQLLAHWNRPEDAARRLVVEISPGMRQSTITNEIISLRRNLVPKTRTRLLSETTAELLQFSVAHFRRDSEATWTSCLENWLVEHPDSEIGSSRSMARRVRDGYSALTGTKWPGTRGGDRDDGKPENRE